MTQLHCPRCGEPTDNYIGDDGRPRCMDCGGRVQNPGPEPHTKLTVTVDGDQDGPPDLFPGGYMNRSIRVGGHEIEVELAELS